MTPDGPAFYDDDGVSTVLFADNAMTPSDDKLFIIQAAVSDSCNRKIPPCFKPCLKSAPITASC